MNHVAPYPLRFLPIPMARPWGGERLPRMFGVAARGGPTGEVWVVSAHPHGMSIVADGPMAGRSLAEAVAEAPGAYLGVSLQERFPLLVKFLDAKENLSVQLHPGDAFARTHERDFGKTEAWVVLEAPPGGEVILGDSLSDRAAYVEAVRTGRIGDDLVRRPVRPGEVVMVPAGTLHAVLAGTTLLEVQEASDVTYRVFDWARTDRELHFANAADVRFGAPEPAPDHTPAPRPVLEGEEIRKSVSCPYFSLTTLALAPGAHTATQPAAPSLFIVTSGSASLTWGPDVIPLAAGSALLVPTGPGEWGIKAGEAVEAVAVTW